MTAHSAKSDVRQMQSAPQQPARPVQPVVETDEEARAAQRRNRTAGYVTSCAGNRAIVSTSAGMQNRESADYWTVGQLISIQVSPNRIVGMLQKIEADAPRWSLNEANPITLHVELMGEVRITDDGPNTFSTGISKFPHMGAMAHRIRHEDLITIFKPKDRSAVKIGNLSQSPEIPAMVSVEQLVTRHFAVVGTTGTGKSTSVALILSKIVAAKPDQRILVIDPHNEFVNAFGDKAHSIEVDTLDLPFWLLTFEELTEVVFRGREPIHEELDTLRDLIPQAKSMYEQGGRRERGMKRRVPSRIGLDTPIPYRMADLISLLDEQIGALDNAHLRPHLRNLHNRLQALMTDPRFEFLFNSRQVTDSIMTALGDIYRVPMRGKPITVFQLSGIPSEVVNAVVSVLCRLAFDLALASDSRIKTLVVCEEAHRYIPADTSTGFAPTRAAIAKIAKEGRKYGVSLAIITQRPNELDPTILSQCNSIFALRLGNEDDQDVMRKAISNASASTITMLSSLADRECIAFGRAVSTAMRLHFVTVPQQSQPKSQHAGDKEGVGQSLSSADLAEAVEALRGNKDKGEDDESTGYDVASAAPAPQTAAPRMPVAAAPKLTQAAAPTPRAPQQAPSEQDAMAQLRNKLRNRQR
ncbi:MAG: DUF87 domain-containing protein [Pseudomonadota bacterium]